MARIDFLETGFDHRFDLQQPQTATRQPHKSRQIGWQQNHPLHRLVLRADQFQYHPLAFIMEERERVRRIKRGWRDQRQNIVNEPVIKPFAVGHIIRHLCQNFDILIGKQTGQLGHNLMLSVHQRAAAADDLFKQMIKRHIIRWHQFKAAFGKL